MRIDSYSFGVMKINGAEYRSDLIVFPAATGRRHGGPDRIRSDWWRKQGHSLAIEDLDDVLDFKPEVLVVGKGASGLLEIPPSTKKLLQQAGIEVLAENTGRAWSLFNEQIEKGRKVAGAFHLTC
jgi:hypothetical protein